MLVMMIIVWLVTVGCFLLYVRRLRGKYTHDNSPIANSEQPVEPVRVFEYKPSTVFPVSKQETQNKQEPCQPAVKIPKVWKKADGKTRHVKTGLVDIMWGDGAIDLKQLAKRYHDAWIKSDFKTLDIIAYRECKPKKPVKNQKVFISKASATKTRKTVTVKKRVTK
jgi:hypothetical protein